MRLSHALAHTGVVVSPQRTNLVLTTYVPDVKFDVLVGHALDVEADGRDSGDILVELQLVQNSCRRAMVSTLVYVRALLAPILWLSFILVFPAASRPSIRMRISLDPKIFPINLDTEPPILGFFFVSRELGLVRKEESRISIGTCTSAPCSQEQNSLLAIR